MYTYMYIYIYIALEAASRPEPTDYGILSYAMVYCSTA